MAHATEVLGCRDDLDQLVDISYRAAAECRAVHQTQAPAFKAVADRSPHLAAVSPCQGAADADMAHTKVGTFTQALYDEAKKKGWTVISIKNDWKQIFPSSIGRAIK
jgi:hypothetical protein